MDRINKILDEEPEIKDAENPIFPDDIKGRIEFRRVTFKYQGSKYPALEDINLL